MKTKYTIIVYVILFVSLFANLALGFNVKSLSDSLKDKESEIDIAGEEVNEIGEDIEFEKNKNQELGNNQLVPSDDSEQLVKNFFSIQYEYDNNSYADKFTKIEDYVGESVYSQLNSAGVSDTPSGIEFSNRIEDLQVYFTSEGTERSGLVLLETVYTIDDRENPAITQIFQVKINEENSKPSITELVLVGTFSTMEGS